MSRTRLNALIGMMLMVAGSLMALPSGRPADPPLRIAADHRSGQLCRAAQVATLGAVDSVEFPAFRDWQSKLRESCGVAMTP